jgi:phage tail-like protein
MSMRSSLKLFAGTCAIVAAAASPGCAPADPVVDPGTESTTEVASAATSATAVGSYAVSINGVIIATAYDVAGFAAPTIALQETAPDGKFKIVNLPGRPKAGSVVITRTQADNAFQQWLSGFRAGTVPRQDVTLILRDVTGAAIYRWHLVNAFPSSLRVGSLVAGATTVITETLTLGYELFDVPPV